MTPLSPVPVTPADRFEGAIRKALDDLIMRTASIHVTPAEADRAAASILRAADLYAGERVAAEAQAIARTPRSQTDPMHRREDGDVA